VLVDKFNDASIESICRILAERIIGSAITKMFKSIGDINEDPLSERTTKWKRLDAACHVWQQKYNCGNKILEMIEYIANPARYVTELENFESLRTDLNLQLSFLGLTLNQNGKIDRCDKVSTINEARQKIDFLRSKLELRNVHTKILTYCRPDIVNEDYFSLIFESSKCIFDKIREMTGINLDGNKLIIECFDDKWPVIIFNKMVTQSEKDEYMGFSQLLLSIGKMFRNPRAHELKFFSYTDLEECLDILTLISFALKKLDKCSVNHTALYRKGH